MLQMRQEGSAQFDLQTKRRGGKRDMQFLLELTFSSSFLKASACFMSVPTKWDLSIGSEKPYFTIAFSVALMVLRTSVVRSQRAAAVDL